jgi:hypothetical protein
MNDKINQLQNNLDKLRAFLRARPMSLPSGQGLYCIYIDPKPNITLNCGMAPNPDGIARILACAGEDWGREGWVKNPDYYNKYYNWTKTLDGVQLEILEAEQIPLFTSQPVPSTAFPLQLHDVEV